MKLFYAAAVLTMFAAFASAQTNDFNYQGNLNINGQPANGSYDFEFRLYTAESGGSQISVTATRTAVTVTNGVFNVVLAFPLLGGSTAFPGADRWLETAVRQNGSGGGFQQLLPRTKINSSPYAITAANANNAANLAGVAPNQYVQTSDPRLSDARVPTAGSSNYIQNSTDPQAAANFNISGNGTAGGTFSANIVNATQYHYGGNRILGSPGFNNLFAGVGAGAVNTGSNNAFFGRLAGNANTTGFDNAFFGRSAGEANTTGNSNAFFGSLAGNMNMTGNVNAFFGDQAGFSNTTGSSNAFFGRGAGSANTVGESNTFVGRSSGYANTGGGNNTFVGRIAGGTNTTGFNNTALGQNADFADINLSFATAIGSFSVASLSNSIYLGRPGGEDTVRIPGSTIINGSLVVDTLGSTTGNVHLCRNTANRLSLCTSNFAEKSSIEALSMQIDAQRSEIMALKVYICSRDKSAPFCKENK